LVREAALATGEDTRRTSNILTGSNFQYREEQIEKKFPHVVEAITEKNNQFTVNYIKKTSHFEL
jgi:hypothetical protein